MPFPTSQLQPFVHRAGQWRSAVDPLSAGGPMAWFVTALHTPIRKLLGDAKPSMTTIGVQALYTPEILVEIEMAVRLP